MFQQQKGKLWLGAIYNQAVRAQFYIGLIQLFLVAVAAIRTIQEWIPWVTFPLLLIGLFVIYVVAGVVDYYLAVPSVVAFQNEQVCKHGNPVMVSLLRIEKHLGIEEKEEKPYLSTGILSESDRLILESLDNNGLPHDFLRSKD